MKRRRRVVLAGYRDDDAAVARRGLEDPDPRVHVAALGALDRLGLLTADDVIAALGFGDDAVRRRAVEAAPAVRGRGSCARRSRLPSRRPLLTPTRSSSWARRGAWASAAIVPPYPGWSRTARHHN